MEVLKEMKDDRTLRHIPVVVLTTSEAERDILASYELGANCFISKPVDLTEFRKVVESIDDFWFTIVKLPSPSRIQ
jgi:two-component system, chemotaxis family, response regulator Rcp1